MSHDETSERDLSGSFCRLLHADKQTAQNNLKSALFSILVRVLWQPWSWLCDCLYIYTLYILMWSQVQSNFDLCPVTPAHSLQLLQVSHSSWERDCRHNCREDRIPHIYKYCAAKTAQGLGWERVCGCHAQQWESWSMWPLVLVVLLCTRRSETLVL